MAFRRFFIGVFWLILFPAIAQAERIGVYLQDHLYNLRIHLEWYDFDWEKHIGSKRIPSPRWMFKIESLDWQSLWWHPQANPLPAEIGEEVIAFFRNSPSDYASFVKAQQVEDEMYALKTGWTAIYDANGLPVYHSPYRFCTSFNMPADEYYQGPYCFNKFSELPAVIQKGFYALLNKPVDWLLETGEVEKNRRPNDKYKEYKANKEWYEEKVSKMTEEEKKSDWASENPAQQLVTMFQYMMEEVAKARRAQGEITPEQKAGMLAYVRWQETRCARLPFEEAKKDFECRSIQIRDYLRYGPQGAPAEEMRKRASRPLAPEPPKYLWWEESQPSPATRK